MLFLFYFQFLTKTYCLYFQPIRLQLRRYRSGYSWNRKFGRIGFRLNSTLKLNLVRPIPLISVDIKVASKALANRLKALIHNLISVDQLPMLKEGSLVNY